MKLPENIAKQILADHQARPRHRGELPDAPHAAQDNPGCGDRVTVWARVEDGRLAALSFTGRGCAVSQASASLMTVALRGKTLAQAHELAAQYRAMVLGETGDEEGGDPALGDLLALAGAGRLLRRRTCALLAWNALEAALAAGPQGGVTGEVAQPGEKGAP